MGQFSWITSDTKRSILSSFSDRNSFTVHLITEDGQVFTEKNYEGYGEFGGKDIYALIAELNNLKYKTEDEARDLAISLVYKNQITDGKQTLEFGKDFGNWEAPIEKAGGKTANQLVKEGWKNIYPNGYGEWNIAAKNGIKCPKLVEKLPAADADWKQLWDSLPYPVDCPHQGFFYEEDDDN